MEISVLQAGEANEFILHREDGLCIGQDGSTWGPKEDAQRFSGQEAAIDAAARLLAGGSA